MKTIVLILMINSVQYKNLKKLKTIVYYFYEKKEQD